MVTPDKDFGQLVTDRILMYKPGRAGSPPEVLGPRDLPAGGWRTPTRCATSWA